eukprot:CAMPEP_0172842948 /NCGR_PEP_ID=MMETSP1075-20121228/31109_1 /TAXON_ID=2916 /ORGANISM="Ceratium fusus, Strain PA161109" /LENGTH=65 /DNA_ID=CAMNT_0013687145 /DNA_START=259 /DNA_END=454 /DNA_ORIENTATION=-
MSSCMGGRIVGCVLQQKDQHEKPWRPEVVQQYHHHQHHDEPSCGRYAPKSSIGLTSSGADGDDTA